MHVVLQGCIELLERSGVQISGKSACVVGRSNIVGTPAAMLLQRRDATVTVVHSRTPNGQEICSKADIVIAACGKAEMITGDWIKEGAVVIDVGINAVDVSSHAFALWQVSICIQACFWSSCCICVAYICYDKFQMGKGSLQRLEQQPFTPTALPCRMLQLSVAIDLLGM